MELNSCGGLSVVECPNADLFLSYSAHAEITQETSRLELSSCGGIEGCRGAELPCQGSECGKIAKQFCSNDEEPCLQ